MTLAYPGTMAIARAIITFWIPLPRTAATSRASIIIGKPISASIILMMTILITPPKKPAIRPRLVPIAAATPVVTNPTRIAVRAPIMRRLNVSLPCMSVPNTYCPLYSPQGQVKLGFSIESVRIPT